MGSERWRFVAQDLRCLVDVCLSSENKIWHGLLPFAQRQSTTSEDHLRGEHDCCSVGVLLCNPGTRGAGTETVGAEKNVPHNYHIVCQPNPHEVGFGGVVTRDVTPLATTNVDRHLG